MTLLMHVDRAALHRGDPAIIVERGDSVILAQARRVELLGPGRLVQYCGPEGSEPKHSVQVETDEPVLADGKEIR